MAPRPGELPKAIESVLVRPTATATDLTGACTEARERHVAALCVLPCHVAQAARELAGSDVKVVALVSFPFGADVTAVRAAAVAAALDDGADDIEIVIALSTFLSGDVNATRDDLITIVRQVRLRQVSSGRRVPQVRAVIETAYLDDRRIRLAARVIRAAGVDMAVTATGLGPRTVSALDVELLREELDGAITIKAAGGVRTYQEAVELIAAGAHRVGANAIGALLDGAQTKGRR